LAVAKRLPSVTTTSDFRRPYRTQNIFFRRSLRRRTAANSGSDFCESECRCIKVAFFAVSRLVERSIVRRMTVASTERENAP
jgi:hypothetical protein